MLIEISPFFALAHIQFLLEVFCSYGREPLSSSQISAMVTIAKDEIPMFLDR